mgnify:CR=1 FL=1
MEKARIFMSDNKKMHYAWKVMIALILIKLGTGSASYATMGNFVAPVVRELECQVSELTMFISIEAIAMALLYTTASKVLTTAKRIGLVMGFASIAEVIGIMLMSTYKSVYMFYISALMIGVAQSFTGFVAIPIVLNMWFKKKTGTVLGIIVAIQSASSIAYGLLSAQLITGFGWRSAYLIMGIMAAIITVPAVFLIVKSPAQVGCEPYGADDAVPETKANNTAVRDSGEPMLTRKQAFRMPLIYLAWMACVMYSYGSGVSGYITPFSTMELGQSTNFGAFAGMFMSFGAILCSLILGRINDKYGVRAGLIWGAVTTTIGFGVMLASHTNPILVFPAAFAVGLGSSMYTVQCPLLALKVVGSKSYSEIWPIMMMINSLVGGGLYSSIGLFYDKLGSYNGAFIMCICLYIGALILGSLSLTLSEKRKMKVSEFLQ